MSTFPPITVNEVPPEPWVTSFTPPVDVLPGYESLFDVLRRALDQAQAGKGAQRHAQGKPFNEQPMQTVIDMYGVGFALGQAAKKSQESMRLPTTERQVAELLGAINYLAGAVIAIERNSK